MFEVEGDLEASILNIGENEQNKTLGIFWNANSDNIQYHINVTHSISNLTKRVFLSLICKIFDLLGLVGPIIVIAKLLMQELWKLTLDWDDELLLNLCKKWLNFYNELELINNYKISRHVIISDYIKIELHGFSDASEKTYGACVYICSKNSNSTY